MTRLPSLTVRLVPPQGGAAPAWSLELLTAHLEAAGHTVEQSTSDPSSTADVVHCFDLATAQELGLHDPTPLVVSPAVDEHDPGRSADPSSLSAAAGAVVRSRTDQARVHDLGVPWSRAWIVPAAVDVDLYRRLGPMANRTERFRLVVELSGPDDGLEDVLVAMAKLEDVELVALVAEADSIVDLSGRDAAVRAFAEEVGASARVVVVAPTTAGERAWWMRSAHVAVAVPHVGGAIDFVAQAMACGTPVIATPVDALADLVVHGVTGFHVPVADPLSVARAVRLVVDDDFGVESYGMAAADRALSRFAWPRVTNELVGVYRRVAMPTQAGASDADAPDDVEIEDERRDDDERIA